MSDTKNTTVLFEATDVDGETVTVYTDRYNGKTVYTVEVEGEDGYRGAILTPAQFDALRAALNGAVK